MNTFTKSFININQLFFGPCRQASEDRHVLWWDNFSKMYAVALQSISKGAFKSCLWTGFAMKKYIGRPFPEWQYDIGKRGMEKNLFTDSVLNDLKATMRQVGEEKWNYLSNSIVRRYGVNSIPLKPEVDERKEPHLFQILSESRDGVRTFMPLGILPENVGSNRGLLLLLKSLSDKHASSERKKYSFLTVDCNIFLRILKV